MFLTFLSFFEWTLKTGFTILSILCEAIYYKHFFMGGGRGFFFDATGGINPCLLPCLESHVLKRATIKIKEICFPWGA